MELSRSVNIQDSERSLQRWRNIEWNWQAEMGVRSEKKPERKKMIPAIERLRWRTKKIGLFGRLKKSRIRLAGKIVSCKWLDFRAISRLSLQTFFVLRSKCPGSGIYKWKVRPRLAHGEKVSFLSFENVGEEAEDHFSTKPVGLYFSAALLFFPSLSLHLRSSPPADDLGLGTASIEVATSGRRRSDAWRLKTTSSVEQE